MDLSLRARIRAGDPQAFAQLFRAHAQAVYGHAARLSGDLHTAEDVVSLTFLEAWRLREKLRPDGEWPDEGEGDDGVRAWLFGVATNVLRNTRRTTRRHAAALGRLQGRPSERDTAPDFADELVGRMEDADRLAAARAALARLNRREREVFALCVWSGLSYAAAAEALDVPVSTVRSRLSRARHRLRGLAEAELARRGGSSAGPPAPGRAKARERTGLQRGNGQVQVGREQAARSTQGQERGR
ncbi:RNA polymerase sigma factor [Streptomyces lomondensis]|uniref:RNA polymerase sigma factor n=1 Tax=Streptomyces lomondensis TaxID=68229 RepID=UPI00167A608C|nr:RNA polymerase sigma factor [Streptomyces lomondensis]MCF0082721.1 RNA polymerase sigma factor [Streptomyces lomondensis]